MSHESWVCHVSMSGALGPDEVVPAANSHVCIVKGHHSYLGSDSTVHKQTAVVNGREERRCFRRITETLLKGIEKLDVARDEGAMVCAPPSPEQ